MVLGSLVLVTYFCVYYFCVYLLLCILTSVYTYFCVYLLLCILTSVYTYFCVYLLLCILLLCNLREIARSSSNCQHISLFQIFLNSRFYTSVLLVVTFCIFCVFPIIVLGIAMILEQLSVYTYFWNFLFLSLRQWHISIVYRTHLYIFIWTIVYVN